MDGTRGSAVGGAVAIAGFVVVLLGLAERGWRFPMILAVSSTAPRAIYAIVVAVAAACAIAPVAWRRWLLLAGSAVGYPLILGVWVIPLAGYAGFICALVRTRVAVKFQVIAAVALWCSLPGLRIVTNSVSGSRASILAVLWASLIYSALFIIIERRRYPAEASTLDELVYLFALPRLAERSFSRSARATSASATPCDRPGAWSRAAWRWVVMASSWRSSSTRSRRRCAACRTPCSYSATSCGSMRWRPASCSARWRVFRLLGFDLASGFRQPFLSRSFSEFFRRYNHYVRDAVMSLFYFPLLGSLRTALHPRAAVVLSSFGSIFIGSYLLNDFLVPVVTAAHTRQALRSATAPAHLAVLGVYWSLIVIPPLVALPKRADGRPWLPRFVKIVIFNTAFFFIWLELGWHHQMKLR